MEELIAVHRDLGGRFPPGGEPRPLDYGDPTAESCSLREGCGVVDRSDQDRLELVGEDRHRFLNGQVTCDVSALKPGQGTYGFLTSAKGRIEADAAILARDDRFVLILPAGLGPAVRDRLMRYVITDRVEIPQPPAAACLTFIGPAAGRRLEELTGTPVPTDRWSHLRLEAGGRPALVVHEGRLSGPAWSLWAAPSTAAAVLRKLARGSAADADLRLVGVTAFEAFRIETGYGRFGEDFDADNLPQETGIEEAVSLTKGCYLGQEVVARLHYRGQVSRQLRRLAFEGAFAPGDLPGAGTQLILEGRSVGAVTSAAWSHSQERAVGLGMVHRRGFETGTRLEVKGGSAVVA